MKSVLAIFTVFTLFTLISCSQAKKDSGQTDQEPVLPTAQEQPAQANTEPVQAVDAETAVHSSTKQNSAEVMLNPPHGEPFHRCDIPVGAPLNSPPANTTGQTTNNPVQATAPQTSGSAQNIANNPTAPTIENARRINPQAQNAAPANNESKPSMNPPHGQPWHRCDIAVGSPLP